MRLRLILGLIVLTPFLLSAETLFKVKEGLWEVTVSHTGSSVPGISEDALAKMPADQRARVEDMMKQKGVTMNGGTTVVKSCVTREKIAKGMAFSENRENCTRNVANSSPSHLEIKLHCEEARDGGNKMIMDGTTVIDLLGQDSVKGATHIVTNSHGRTTNMDSTFTSKYLGPACGDIK